MTDTPDTNSAPALRKMALSERERELVLAHRAKHATDLAYNQAVEDAAKLVEAGTPLVDDGPARAVWQGRMSSLAALIRTTLTRSV